MTLMRLLYRVLHPFENYTAQIVVEETEHERELRVNQAKLDDIKARQTRIKRLQAEVDAMQRRIH